MLYICTKFNENISKGFRVTELTQFLISKISRRHHSVENIGGVMILILNTFSDHARNLIFVQSVMKISQRVSELWRDLIYNIQNFQRGTILKKM